MKNKYIFATMLMAVMAWSSVASAGLVAYWPFDTDFSNAQGNSAYDGTAAAIGGATVITSTVGEYKLGTGGLKLDNSVGNINYVDVTGNVLLGTPGTFTNTVAAWYKYEDIDGEGSDDRNFVWETAPSDWALSFGIRTRTIEDVDYKEAQWYTEAPSTGATLDDGPFVDDGQWHHAAVVIDEATESLKFYHDGALLDDVTITGLALDWDGSTSFHIGNHRAGDGGRNWDGYIDDIAVWDHCLSSADIAYLWNNGDGNAVPEPATILLVGLGGLSLLRRRRA